MILVIECVTLYQPKKKKIRSTYPFNFHGKVFLQLVSFLKKKILIHHVEQIRRRSEKNFRVVTRGQGMAVIPAELKVFPMAIGLISAGRYRRKQISLVNFVILRNTFFQYSSKKNRRRRKKTFLKILKKFHENK